MSSVPLMTLHNSKRNSPDFRESDQISEDEEDPLESVLARMKQRPRNFRSQDFWSSLIFTGITCFLFGFIVSYIVFLSLDKNNNLFNKINEDADPEIASYLLKHIDTKQIRKYVSMLKVNADQDTDTVQNARQADFVHRHFHENDFDSVSQVIVSTLLLSYPIPEQNKVSIIDELNRATTSYAISYSLPKDLQGHVVKKTLRGIVVYVNFGRDTDFVFLEKHNVNIKDRILLARMGKMNPMELVDAALTAGAKAVLLFHDPQQYPPRIYGEVPRQVLTPAQLGTLQYLHGDPSLSDTDRGININGEQNVGCVPVMTISAHDAEQILRQMSSDEMSTEDWRGSLNTSYPYGPGFSNPYWQLAVEFTMENIERPYHHVIAAIRGHLEPDRLVVLGNARESLIPSGEDPLAATAILLELARVFGRLKADQDWRPRRTIVLCSWGSVPSDGHFISMPLDTNWGHLLETRSVAYLNVDVPLRDNGSLAVQATPLLARAIIESSQLVPNPSIREARQGQKTVFDTWLRTRPSTTQTKRPAIDVIDGDYRNILFSYGVPSINFHFDSPKIKMSSGPNTPNNLTLDEKLRYYRAIGQLWSLLTWKMADSLALPLDLQGYADFLVHNVQTLVNKYTNVFKNIKDNHIREIKHAIKVFKMSADNFQRKIDHLETLSPLELRITNDQLMQLEKSFMHVWDSYKSSIDYSHVVLSGGGGLGGEGDQDANGGLIALQILLDELASSPGNERLEEAISEYMAVLVHCIHRANDLLQDYLPPVTKQPL